MLHEPPAGKPRELIEYIDLKYLKDQPSLRFDPRERMLLNQISGKLAKANNLDELLDDLFSVSKRLTNCQRLSIAFLEEGSHRIVCYGVRAEYEPLHLEKGFTETLQGSSLLSILASGHARIINDLEAYLTSNPKSRSAKLLLKEGIQSNMTCPILMEGRFIGLLFRASRQKNAFAMRHVALHLNMAENLGFALERAFRLEEVRLANKGYMEMLGFVSHELKNPIASIVLKAKMFVEGYYGDLQDKQKIEIEKMIRKGEFLLQLVRDYLDLARLEDESLSLKVRKNVDFIHDVLDQAEEMVVVQAEERDMQITQWHTPDDILAECDPYLMRIVMNNLLSNAVKYGEEGGEIRVQAKMNDNHLFVSVWNQGPGFPSQHKQRLFRKFSRLDTPELAQRKGTGVGLYNVRRIIRLHGGEIKAQSAHGEWAEFAFIIPQPLQVTMLGDSVELTEDFADSEFFTTDH